MDSMNKNQTINSEIADLRVCRMWVDDQNITHQEFKPGVDVSIEDALEISRMRKKMLKGGPGPRLTDIRGVRAASKAVRDFGKSEDVAKMTTAFAIIVDSPLTRTLGTIFINLGKPPYPTRMFTEKEKALIWIQGYLD